VYEQFGAVRDRFRGVGEVDVMSPMAGVEVSAWLVCLCIFDCASVMSKGW